MKRQLVPHICTYIPSLATPPRLRNAITHFLFKPRIGGVALTGGTVHLCKIRGTGHKHKQKTGHHRFVVRHHPYIVVFFNKLIPFDQFTQRHHMHVFSPGQKTVAVRTGLTHYPRSPTARHFGIPQTHLCRRRYVHPFAVRGPIDLQGCPTHVFDPVSQNTAPMFN